MLTIHKFDLIDAMHDASEFTINLPPLATILSAQVQRGRPKLWVLLETEQAKAPRRFYLRATGQDLSQQLRGKFISTFQLDSGLVFHLFEA